MNKVVLTYSITVIIITIIPNIILFLKLKNGEAQFNEILSWGLGHWFAFCFLFSALVALLTNFIWTLLQ